MSHLVRIMREQMGEDLEKIAESEGSFLVKVACSMLKSGSEGGLSFPDNPILGALQTQMTENPPPESGQLSGMLMQILQADLQMAMHKVQAEGSLLPIRMERDRVELMADLIRAKLRASENMMEAQKLQKEMALEMGMAPNNVAVQSMGGGPPAIAGPGPQGPGPQGPGPQGPAPQGPPVPQGAPPGAPAGPPAA